MAGQDLFVWAVLAIVLYAVARGQARFVPIAVGGLLVIGLSGIVPQPVILSGFSHPALATIVSLYVVGQGISESGLLTGLGTLLEHRLRTHRGQVLGLSLVVAGLSAFMSNVGAVAALLPTAIRMARRAGIAPGRYGIPVAFAAVLGGTMTLAGSAPTVIVSGYRSVAIGQPFRMFDYLPHGGAILLAGLALWQLQGRRWLRAGASVAPVPDSDAGHVGETGPAFAPLATRQRRLCLLFFGSAVVATTAGWASPAIAFGLAAVLMVLAGVLTPVQAYGAINTRIVIFLGAMLGFGRIMEETGALARLTNALAPAASTMPRFALLAAVFGLACVLGNILNNAAAAAVLAPLALELAALGVPAGRDALLMAVAAGSCLAIVLPTHQAILLGMSNSGYSAGDVRRAGLPVVLLGGVAAVLVIGLVWR